MTTPTTTRRYRAWKTSIQYSRHLSNLDVQTRGIGVVLMSLEDFDLKEQHVFWFTQVLGFRYEDSFNTQRVANTVIVEDSDWIGEMTRKPVRTIDLTTAVHFDFSFHDGNFEIVAREYPLYRKCASDGYAPHTLRGADFAALPVIGDRP